MKKIFTLLFCLPFIAFSQDELLDETIIHLATYTENMSAASSAAARVSTNE